MKFIKNGQYQDRPPNTETSRADDFFLDVNSREIN
jgi:hypothetical protein